MKVNRLETHDRYQHLMKDQSANVFQGAEDCLKSNELSLAIQEKSPYVYIFGHARTADNGIDKVLYWQPRLSIPSAQDNSYLFRALSNSDIIEVVWIIPPKVTWAQYRKGNVTESDICAWSIQMYKTQRPNLEKPHPDDMTDEKARLIMKQIVDERREYIRLNKNKAKIITDLEAYSKL